MRLCGRLETNQTGLVHHSLDNYDGGCLLLHFHVLDVPSCLTLPVLYSPLDWDVCH